MRKDRKKVKIISGFIVFAMMLMILNSMEVSAAGSNSVYLSLASDYTVTTTTTILTTTLTTYATQTKLYMQSDGRYYSSSEICAGMQIKVDSGYVGNCSTIDWRGSKIKAQHSYDCVAGVAVGPGSHTFSLVAQVLGGSGSFIVGAASNLSVMNNITVDMQCTSSASNSQSFNFTTYGISQGTPVPHTPVLSLNVNNSAGPIIALGSGRALKTNAEGDAMLGIYKDGLSLPNNEANWTTNDIYSGAELQAPLYSHAYINATGIHTISMDATELPWMPSSGENGVQYSVGSNSTLVVMDGSQQVCGAGTSLNADTDNDTDYTYIGDGSGSGQTIQLSSGTVTIPSGHDGVVMFDSKIKMQPCGDSTTSGNVSLWIEIDGVQCGSIGVQGIVAPNNISERTLSASYLAAGSKALSVGTHTVTVKIKTQGSPSWALNELPLLWFDGQSSNNVNNNWEVGGTGQNVTLSTSGSATAINFAPSYNWSTEWAQLPNKVAPIDTGTFAFKFAVNSLAGGWIPFVLCWAANAAGSLNTNGLTFLVTGNNLGIFNTSSGSYFSAPLLANVPINTSPNMCYPVTEQLEQEQMLL